ncbi:MAG: PAS domain S-box protein [Acidobacteriota bacterium]
MFKELEEAPGEATQGAAEIAPRERLLRAVFDGTHSVILVGDDEGRFVDVNPAACAFFGLTREELIGRQTEDFTLPGWDQASARRAYREHGHAEGDIPLRLADGSVRVLHYTTTANILPGRHLAVARDVTKERQDADEIRQSRALLEQAQEVATMGSWTVDLRPGAARPISGSKEVFRILGIEEAEFDGLGATVFERVHPDDRAPLQEAAAQAILEGTGFALDLRVARPDGELRWVHDRARVECNHHGVPIRLIGVMQDITERKRLEAQFLQAQKMESVGRMAGGVAHDFNNLLTAILGYAEMMRRDIQGTHPHARAVEEIERAAQRAAALTRQLLVFSRKQRIAPKVIDVNLLVSDMERMLRRMIGEDVHLQTALAPGLWSVRADPGQLEQVLMNLAVNSRDAMPQGGGLRLTTRNALVTQEQARGIVGGHPGECVVLTVSDDGTGMEPAVLAHLFEPFFTTKDIGKGTGLGLATVYGIVRQAGGFIHVDSSPGAGTTFEVFLPRSEESIRAVRRAQPLAVTDSSGTETILLVEDEAVVRRLAADLLASAGYQVIDVGNGAEALAAADSHPGTIHLLLTDVILPGMSGVELAERFRALCPSARTVFMSGYTADALAEQAHLASDIAFLQKPFNADGLMQSVRAALDRPRAAPSA